MEPTVSPNSKLTDFYDAAEQEYLRSLPPEHFIEATDHAHQRKITLESFDVVRAARPEIQCFSELLIQYPRGKRKKLGQVVPDNFVVIHPEPIVARGSFNIPLQPVGPLLVLEYISKYNKRKDYVDSYEKYEKELKVPYYLLFYPEDEELTLFRSTAKGFAPVRTNDADRFAIPELELEAAMLGGWVRFWFRGNLVPLPGEMMRQMNATRDQLDAARIARDAAEQRATDAEAEIARLRAELAKRSSGG